MCFRENLTFNDENWKIYSFSETDRWAKIIVGQVYSFFFLMENFSRHVQLMYVLNVYPDEKREKCSLTFGQSLFD